MIKLSEDRPDVQRRGQGKDQAGEEDCRSGELKRAVFLVLEVRGTYFDKKQDRKDHIHNREYDLVDYVLDLFLSRIPRAFNGACHVAAGESGRREQRADNGNDNDAEQDFETFPFHDVCPPKILLSFVFFI